MGPSRDEREMITDYVAGRDDAVRRVHAWIDAAVRAHAPAAPPDRDDLAQEVRARLFEALRRGRFERRASLRTFIDRIARNVAVDVVRARACMAGAASAGSGKGRRGAAGESDVAEAAIGRIHLGRMIDREGREKRRLLEMILLEEMPYADAARRLGLPIGTVKSRVARFRARMTRTRAD